ncbi:MAG TPA: hypothetical protein VMX17_15720 [Candidatus Glassbacteria bacterium]|nr:hypothetical protein [Candidatus Glassbacteria bacterium]
MNKIETCSECPFSDTCYFSVLGKCCAAIDKFLDRTEDLHNYKLEMHAERVEHVKLMGALEELSLDSGFPGVTFYVFPPINPNDDSDKPLRVSEHSLEVKNIFKALREHAKSMGGFARRAINDHYSIDIVRSHLEEANNKVYDLIGYEKAFGVLREAYKKLKKENNYVGK